MCMCAQEATWDLLQVVEPRRICFKYLKLSAKVRYNVSWRFPERQLGRVEFHALELSALRAVGVAVLLPTTPK